MSRHPFTPEPIAVTAIGCRLPGAKNPGEFWNMLRLGRDAIAPVPEARFNRKCYFDPKKGVTGRSYCDKAALIDYSEAVVPGGCITRQDIEKYDPAHIILARVAEEALRESGNSLAAMQGRNVGVYIGHAASSGLGGEYTYGIHVAQVAEYLRELDEVKALPEKRREEIIRALVARVRQKTPWRTRENNPHLAPGDAAQFLLEKFGWTGPGMVFNSACASALQAIGHGMKALQLGRIDAALVGGASCFHSDTLVLFSAAHSLSATGSYPFTEKADGLIPGEGCALFLLKTLKKAVADGDEIHAVLPDIGISSDGRGASLWAPRKEGQIEAMARAYEHGVDLAGLEYVEGHFTSTHLGDKTEIESITELLHKNGLTKKIPVGSVKRNIGHGLEVAGAVGLLKVILSLKNGTIPSAVEPGSELNKDIDWNKVPLFPPDQNLAWPVHRDGTPRRAAVNAFGIGGLNVHLVVEDFVGSRWSGDYAGASSRAPSEIAVIGVGTLLPGAHNTEEFQQLLEAPRRQIRPLPVRPWDASLFADRTRWGSQTIDIPGGGIVENYQFDWKRHRIPPKQVNNGNPLQFMILDAVDQAFRQADIKEDFDHGRTGCVVGTMFGGDFATQLVMGLRLPETCDDLKSVLREQSLSSDSSETIARDFTKCVLKHMPALVDETGSFTSSALASRITKAYHLMGGGVALEAGNGSAVAALGASIDMLRTRACDLMLCVAGQHDLTPGAYHELALSDRVASTVDFSSPFDSRARGTLPGEGCVVLLLKRLDDARREGDPVLGIIRGVGAAASTQPQKAVVDSVRRALDDAGLESEAIRGLEAAGNGLPEMDKAELQALESVYGNSVGNKGTLPIGTTVATVGHLGAASGLVSLAAGLTALDRERLPGTPAFEKAVESSSAFAFSGQAQKIGTHDPEGRLIVGVDVCTDFGNCFHVLLQRGTPVTPDPSISAPSRSPQNTEQLSNSVFHFDATAARRERLRSGKGKAPVAPPKPMPEKKAVLAPAAPVAPVAKAPQAAKGPVTISVSKPTPSAPAVPKKAAVPTPVAPAAPTASVSEGPDRAEVEEFLITYVVEQTEYPREMIDLDESLTELGIDSIKKAQMFGELAECFDVQPRADLKFEDITTLRMILDVIAEETATAPKPVAVPAPVAPTASETPNRAEVEKFLITYVVEQSGYPPHLVDLDGLLEERGIDSIRKAQLLGELVELYDMHPLKSVTFEDITTLRSILNAVDGKSVASSATSAAKTSAAAASVSEGPDRAEVEEFLITYVVEQTEYPREMIDLDESLTELGIDSIKKAQMFGELAECFDVQPRADLKFEDITTLRMILDVIAEETATAPKPVAVPAPLVSTPVVASEGPDRAEVEEFLITYVVEQTEYPREMIDLDESLTELGIDSIKKAQMFGELAECFDVQPRADLKFEDITTLRMILDVITE